MKKILLSLSVLVAAVLLLYLFFSFRRYNVILITVDTLRSDYLSIYNPQAASTPNIDRIGKEGVVFENAFSLIPITLPAHSSMMTSIQPYKLRLFNNGERFGKSKKPTLADHLRNKGYSTGAFVSLGVLKKGLGPSNGFDVYEDAFAHLRGRFYKLAPEINELAIPWIEKHRNKKFFAWIHYSDPHEPYVTIDAPPDTEIFFQDQPAARICIAKKERYHLKLLLQPGENVVRLRSVEGIDQTRRFLDEEVFVTPEEKVEVQFREGWTDSRRSHGGSSRYFDREADFYVMNKTDQPIHASVIISGGIYKPDLQYIRKNYVAEVQYVDRYIGQLWNKLDDLGLLDNTIVILTADHGEGLKTHGILGHVSGLWNEILHVPFMVYVPKLGYSGKRATDLANHLDIMPTVLDLLHIRTKAEMEGFSLKPHVSWSLSAHFASKEKIRRRSFAATYRPEARVNTFAMIDRNMKIVYRPQPKLRLPWEAYDLANDPGERRNLVRQDPPLFRTLKPVRELLMSYGTEAEEAHRRRDNPVLSAEEQEILRSLGYISED